MPEYDSIQESREQNAEYLGFMASETIRVGNEIFEIPNPSLLTDEQQERYDVLQRSLEELDRHDAVDKDGNALKGKGAIKEPHRIGGEPQEHYNVRLAKAVLGDRYPAFKAAGGSGNHFAVIWWKMDKALGDRRKADLKSAEGDRPVEAVPGDDKG